MLVSVMLAFISGILAGLMSHAVGVAPILAGVVCASCFLRWKETLLVGVVALLVRELTVGVSSFTLVRLIGVLSVSLILLAVRTRQPLVKSLVGLAIASPVYHLILTTGDWLLHTCSGAAQTQQGFVATLTSNLPYFQRALPLEALLVAAFIGIYTLVGAGVKLRWPSLVSQPART